MTAITPDPTPLVPNGVPPAGGSPATAIPGGASFEHALVALVDRAIVETSCRSDHRFAGGTMRSSVERFDERGFFEDRAVADPHETHALLASGSTTAPGVPQPPFQPAGSFSQLQSDPASIPDEPQSPLPLAESLRLLQSDPMAPSVEHIPPASPPAAIAVRVLASDSADANQATTTGSTPITSLRSHATAPLASLLMSHPSKAVTADDGSTPQGDPFRAVFRGDRPTLASSHLKVSLDHTDMGVAVSVVADVEADNDADAIREAVAHMLARHGLVLSELRLTRRPGADSQDRKD